MNCIVVAFYSIRKFNPDFDLQLTTNRNLPEPFNRQLSSIGVQTKITEYEHLPPTVFGDSFRGCFYLFDAIMAETESALFIDPDIFCSSRIPNEIFLEDSIAVFKMNFPDNRDINGLNLVEARTIFSDLLNQPGIFNHEHLGGEAIFVPKSRREEFIADFESIWLANKNHAIEGRKFLTTEEHIISLVLSEKKTVPLNQIILRIWTDTKYRLVEGGSFNPSSTPLWHLPAEKSYGFYRAYRLISKEKFLISNDEARIQKRALQLFNIGRKPIQNKIIRFWITMQLNFTTFVKNNIKMLY